MPSLRELQLRFAQDVLGDSVRGTELVRASGSPGDRRTAVYRRTIRSNYRNAMDATYPAVRRIVGAPLFMAAVDAYVAAHPSQSGDLNEYGHVFGDFLERYPGTAALPYLPDVARLEWAIDEANRAADSRIAPDAVLRALSQVTVERLPDLHLRIERSCRLVSSPYPLLRIWQVNQSDYAGDLRVDFEAGPDRLRIRRDPSGPGHYGTDTNGVAIERVDASDFEWLAALAEGATLADAIDCARNADPSFDLQSALHRFIGDGTIAAIDEDSGAESRSCV